MLVCVRLREVTDNMHIRLRSIYSYPGYLLQVLSDDTPLNECVCCCFYSRTRKKMQNVSNLSILTMLIMYMLSALFGYLTFYGKESNRQL